MSLTESRLVEKPDLTTTVAGQCIPLFHESCSIMLYLVLTTYRWRILNNLEQSRGIYCSPSSEYQAELRRNPYLQHQGKSAKQTFSKSINVPLRDRTDGVCLLNTCYKISSYTSAMTLQSREHHEELHKSFRYHFGSNTSLKLSCPPISYKIKPTFSHNRCRCLSYSRQRIVSEERQ